jgi:hypothetical protein
MQNPSKWWVHVLPGFVVILGLSIKFLGVDYLMSLTDSQWSVDIASSAVVVALSYIVGYCLNALLKEIVAPILRLLRILPRHNPLTPVTIMRFEQYANPVLVNKLLYESYDLMIFNRSLFASVLILDSCLLTTIWNSKWLIIGTVAVTLALILNWWHQRSGYHAHMKQIKDLLRELMNS